MQGSQEQGPGYRGAFPTAAGLPGRIRPRFRQERAGGAARAAGRGDFDQRGCQSQLSGRGQYNHIREHLYFIKSPRGADSRPPKRFQPLLDSPPPFTVHAAGATAPGTASPAPPAAPPRGPARLRAAPVPPRPGRLHLPPRPFRAAPPAAAGPIPGAAGRRRSAAGLRWGSGAARRGAVSSSSSSSAAAAAAAVGRCGGSWGGSRPQRAPVPLPPPWTAAGAAGAHSSVSPATAGPGPVPSPPPAPCPPRCRSRGCCIPLPRSSVSLRPRKKSTHLPPRCPTRAGGGGRAGAGAGRQGPARRPALPPAPCGAAPVPFGAAGASPLRAGGCCRDRDGVLESPPWSRRCERPALPSLKSPGLGGCGWAPKRLFQGRTLPVSILELFSFS